jgi:hypothetical protein
MTSETRLLRPFEQVGVLEDFFGEIRLRVGNSSLVPDERITLDEDHYRHVPVSVELPHQGRALTDALVSIDEALHGIGLTGEDVCFVVNLYSGFLKISE